MSSRAGFCPSRIAFWTHMYLDEPNADSEPLGLALTLGFHEGTYRTSLVGFVLATHIR